MTMTPEDFDRVCSENDSFRLTCRSDGPDVLWVGRANLLSLGFFEAVLQAIQDNNNFEHDNLLHDYGEVMVESQMVLWWIEYWSLDGQITDPHLAEHRSLSIQFL
jgi:hypothetical protein